MLRNTYKKYNAQNVKNYRISLAILVIIVIINDGNKEVINDLS